MLTADLRREQSCGARSFRGVGLDLLKHGDLFFAQLGNRLVPPSGRTENLDRKRARRNALPAADHARIGLTDASSFPNIGDRRYL